MATLPPVGREPDPTAVFCIIEPPFIGGMTPPLSFENAMSILQVRPNIPLTVRLVNDTALDERDRERLVGVANNRLGCTPIHPVEYLLDGRYIPSLGRSY